MSMLVNFLFILCSFMLSKHRPVSFFTKESYDSFRGLSTGSSKINSFFSNYLSWLNISQQYTAPITNTPIFIFYFIIIKI